MRRENIRPRTSDQANAPIQYGKSFLRNINNMYTHALSELSSLTSMGERRGTSDARSSSEAGPGWGLAPRLIRERGPGGEKERESCK